MQRTGHEVVEARLGGLSVCVQEDAGVANLLGEAVRGSGCGGADGRGRRCKGGFSGGWGVVDGFAEVLWMLGRPLVW